ncbi:MAG: helix-turn-helix domain-containing protein [Phycisphaerales bacterium]|nr:MAG: helix-turn-helix domain-containing protein [Phycisphaerales bacterium]
MFRLMRAVRNASGLSASCKAVLFVLATYADRERLESYPSAATIANGAGVSERTARRLLGELDARGLAVAVGSTRRATLVRRLRLEAIEALARRTVTKAPDTSPARSAALLGVTTARGTSAGPPPCRSGAQAMTSGADDPVTATPEPSNHEHPERTTPQDEEPYSVRFARWRRERQGADGGMVQQPGSGSQRKKLALDEAEDSLSDSPGARLALLNRLGVLGVNAERIAACQSLTSGKILRIARDVRADRTVRNTGAVMTARLAAAAGVDLNKRRPLSDEEKAAVARIEQLRRSRTKPPEPDTVAEAIDAFTADPHRPTAFS